MKLNSRWVNKRNFARLGMVVATLLVLTQLGTMLINGFVYGVYSGGNIFELVLDSISLVFYFIVLNNYRMSEDNLFHGYYASLLLIISDFVFPLIMTLVQGVFNFMLIIPSLSLIMVAVYFAFLTLENKRRTVKECKNLEIVGFITAIIMIASGIQGFYVLFNSGFYLKTAVDYISLIVAVLNQLAMSIGLPLVFAFYPFVLYKERYL